MVDIKYPIGKFNRDVEITSSVVENWIKDVEQAPALLRQAVEGLSDAQLDTPYRAEGWTVRQVVHHLADSHINSYVRFKLALTEDSPLIKTYVEEKWAELPDSTMPVEYSLQILEGLHRKWVHLLHALTPADFERTFRHPDSGEVTLTLNIGIYAWHGRHHISHITTLRDRMGW